MKNHEMLLKDLVEALEKGETPDLTAAKDLLGQKEGKVLYKKPSDIKYLDVIDLYAQFSNELELAPNAPSMEFLKLRFDFLDEEVRELKEAHDRGDIVEALDGAIDTAFVAITQAYLIIRSQGFEHIDAVNRTRGAFYEVGKTNLMKEVPHKPLMKIKKPEGWVKPNLEWFLMSNADRTHQNNIQQYGQEQADNMKIRKEIEDVR